MRLDDMLDAARQAVTEVSLLDVRDPQPRRLRLGFVTNRGDDV